MRRDDQPDGAVGPGATGGAMDGNDAIEGSGIGCSCISIGVGAFGANQQANSDG